MGFILECIGELCVEFMLEIVLNKKVSKWIRYPILLVLLAFFGFLFLGLMFLGIKLIKDNQVHNGSIMLMIVLCITIMAIVKLKRNK